MSSIARFTPHGEFVFYVNGKKITFQCEAVDPRTTLLQYLRSAGLTGTKLGCAEGGCGACTVMISNFDPLQSKIQHISANACLTPLCSVNGCHVTTVEGIGSIRNGLHPVQQRMAELHGSQCGFCTPGIVMAIYTIFRINPNATPHDIEESLDGNLCRCTGYRPILDAAKSLSNNKGAAVGTCCRGKGGESACPCAAASGPATTISPSMDPELVHLDTESTVHSYRGVDSEMVQKNRTEPIFPPALMKFQPTSILLSKEGFNWFQPIDMESLLRFKMENPGSKIVVGNSEVGIETKFKGFEYHHIINPVHVPEMKAITREAGGIRVGASVTLNALRSFIGTLVSETVAADSFRLRGLVAMSDMLQWFASNHIRNTASIGGNIVTASPISDMNPMLCACNAVLRIVSATSTESSAPLSRDLEITSFFKGYRKVDLALSEVLQDIFIPFTGASEYVVPCKQAKRREDDISIVTAGIRVKFTDAYIVESCSLSYGGMAPTTILAPKTMEYLTGKQWNEEVVNVACREITKELALPLEVPGGQAAYRVCLASSFLYRAYVRISNQIAELAAAIPADVRSAANGFVTGTKELSRGEQTYYKRTGGMTRSDHTFEGNDAASRAPVGEPIAHKSAELQCSGEAKYTDDIPSPAGTLHGALVMSTKAHAIIKSVKTDKARASPGFVDIFDHKDIRGTNKCGPIHHDEEVFVSKEVHHVGQVIAIVVGRTHDEALRAAKLVEIEYDDLPALISIQDAIKASSYLKSEPLDIINGDITAMESESAVVVSGEVNCGGQEHFYLETNSCLAVPTEAGQLEIFASTQNANETQLAAAHACGIHASHVVCRVKRIGGGFGGKETRSLVFDTPVAVAAHNLGVPVRMNIDRDTDIQLSGQRHAFYGKYRAGCSSDGKLKFMDLELYLNAGFSYDLSEPILGRALFHADAAYKWPAFKVLGYMCKTNQTSHTAYRGFGGPQGIFVTETVIEHLASALQQFHRSSPQRPITSFDIRSSNLYASGEETHFGEVIEQYNVPDAWVDIAETAEVQRRQREADEFNAANKWKKRSICTLPTKYGINYTAKFMNQAGALIHVYGDGTVLISHGGMEMGQGLHTKMCQVVARALNISHEMVHVSETSTATVANATATAGSMSTDMYGMALLNACEQLNERLAPVRASNPDKPWETIVQIAFFSRIDLTAHGYYIVPTDRCGFDWGKKVIKHNSERGTPFNYFTQGVACSEVEVDLLTGDYCIRRVDIIMDVGKSINPALDVGQIEGAFTQGYGWCTTEELIWGDSDHKWVRPGHMFTKGPGTYKIPAFNDTPQDFRVHLMDRSNKRAVHSSKGIGEPPFFLGCSVFFAIRNALKLAREAGGLTDYFQLNLPVTSERIRMSVPDRFSESSTGGADNLKNFQAQGSW